MQQESQKYCLTMLHGATIIKPKSCTTQSLARQYATKEGMEMSEREQKRPGADGAAGKAAAEGPGTHRLHDRGRAGAGREPRDPEQPNKSACKKVPGDGAGGQK